MATVGALQWASELAMGKAVVIPSGCILEPRLTRGVASYLLFDLISASVCLPIPGIAEGMGFPV